MVTALRALGEQFPGITIPDNLANVRATLFRKSVVRSFRADQVHARRPSRAMDASAATETPPLAPLDPPEREPTIFHVYVFLARVAENPWLDVDADTINTRVRERRDLFFASMRGGQSSLSARTRAGLHLRIRAAEWMAVDDLVRVLSDETTYVNEWQKKEFQRYRIPRRQISHAMIELVREIAEARSTGELLHNSLESRIRRIAATKNMSEREWRNELYKEGLPGVGLTSNLDRVQLLSLNLNILPRGVASVFRRGGVADRAAERLQRFIDMVSEEGTQYDVIALQEVFASLPFVGTCHQQHLIGAMRTRGWKWAVTSRAPSVRQCITSRKWTDSGLVIISKFPIVASDSYRFRHSGANLDSGARKGALYAKVQFGSRFLLVFNTHLQASHAPKVASGREHTSWFWGRRSGTRRRTRGIGARYLQDDVYAQIRRQQLLELRQFISSKLQREPGIPWILCGDFNVDAIPNIGVTSAMMGDELDGDGADSREYVDMMRILSPDDSAVDLLKMAYGRHVSTRPPRLHFPRGLQFEYISRHRSKQRLDYVIFGPGSLGELAAMLSKTKIEQFEIVDAPLSGNGASPAHASPPSSRRPSLNRGDAQHRTLSDHYGIGVTLHCRNTLAWTGYSRDQSGNVIARAAMAPARGARWLFWFGLVRLPFYFLLVLCLVDANANWVEEQVEPWIYEVALSYWPNSGSERVLRWVLRRVVVRSLLVFFFLCIVIREVMIVGRTRMLSWLRRSKDEASIFRRLALPVEVRADKVHGESRVVASAVDMPAPWTEAYQGNDADATLADAAAVVSPSASLLLLADHPAVTLHESFLQSVESFGYRECAGERRPLADGSRGLFEFVSYDQVFRRVCNFGAGLVRALPLKNAGTGLPRGARVGILADNSVEWLVAEQACYAYSLVFVPLFDAAGPGPTGCPSSMRSSAPTPNVSDVSFLQKTIQRARLSVIICTRRFTQKVMDACLADGTGRRVSVIQIGSLQYEELEKAERIGMQLRDFLFIEKKGAQFPLEIRAPLPTDVATIVFRSRRNNEPAGVPLTHAHLTASLYSLSGALCLSEKDVHLSLAPLVLMSERIVLLLALSKGMAVGFAASRAHVFDDLQVLKPTFLIGSGAALFRGLFARFSEVLRTWSATYRWAFLAAYRRNSAALRAGKPRSLWGDWFVFRRMARILGGNLRYVVVTDGVLDDALFSFIETCFCCVAVRGLILPETGGFVTLGRLGDVVDQTSPRVVSGYVTDSMRFSRGSADDVVGRPLPGCEVKIASRFGMTEPTPHVGELCVRAPSIFDGYWRDVSLDSEKSVPMMHEDGWFRTGLLCSLSPGGSVVLEGAMSDVLHIGHQYVNIGRMEKLLAEQCPLTRQVWITPVATTEDAVFAYPLLAVVVVDHEQLIRWSSALGLGVFDVDLLCKMQPVQDEYLRRANEIARSAMARGSTGAVVSSSPSPPPLVHAIHVVPDPFTARNGLASPGQRLRRRELRLRYHSALSRLYNGFA